MYSFPKIHYQIKPTKPTLRAAEGILVVQEIPLLIVVKLMVTCKMTKQIFKIIITLGLFVTFKMKRDLLQKSISDF